MRRLIDRCRRGQAMTETILMVPLYFLIVFGLLQIGQLGVALLMVNYGASSVARAVAQDPPKLGPADGYGLIDMKELGFPFKEKFSKLLIGGMYDSKIRGCIEKDSNVTATLHVFGSASVNAFPLLGNFLASARTSSTHTPD